MNPGTLGLPPGMKGRRIAELGLVLNGSGSALTTGLKGWVRSPCSGRIMLGYIGASPSGSLTVKVNRAAGTSAPPAAGAGVISGPSGLVLTSGTLLRDQRLVGWALEICQGDWIGFEVVSAATVTLATVGLSVLPLAAGQVR